MKKFQIKYIKSNNCYISLPRSFSTKLSQTYDDSSICKIIKLTNIEGKNYFLGYNGAISTNDHEIEISDLFCRSNGIKESEYMEINIENQKNVIIKLNFYCENLNDYEVFFNFFFIKFYF